MIEETITKNNLKEIRERFCLNQKEMAKKLGVPAASLCRWELHQRKIPALIAYKVCKLFNVSIWELFDYGKDD